MPENRFARLTRDVHQVGGQYSVGGRIVKDKTWKKGTRVRIIAARSGDEFLVTTALNSKHSWGNFCQVTLADIEIEKEVEK